MARGDNATSVNDYLATAETGLPEDVLRELKTPTDAMIRPLGQFMALFVGWPWFCPCSQTVHLLLFTFEIFMPGDASSVSFMHRDFVTRSATVRPPSSTESIYMINEHVRTTTSPFPRAYAMQLGSNRFWRNTTSPRPERPTEARLRPIDRDPFGSTVKMEP